MARKSKLLNETYKQLASKSEADLHTILNESEANSNDEIDSIVNAAAIEDFQALCEEFQINEEFFNKVKELVETAVDTRVQKEIIRLEKEFDEKYEEAERILSNNLNEQFNSIENKDRTLTEEREILKAEIEAEYIQRQSDLEESYEIKLQELEASKIELDEKAAEYGAYIVEEFSKHAENYINTEVVDKVDKFINYIAEQFLEQNELAIDANIKSELTESFIENLRHVFESHYIDVPDGKLDVLQQQADKISKLESKLNEQISINNAIKRDKLLLERREIINTFCEGMSVNESEKFKKLAESVSSRYSSTEAFKRGLATLKDNASIKPTNRKSDFLSEAFESRQENSVIKPVKPVNPVEPTTNMDDKGLQEYMKLTLSEALRHMSK